MKKLILLFCVSFITLSIYSQADDNHSWLSAQLKIKTSEKTSFNIKPIFRLHENLGTYQNTSVDFSVARKLENGFGVQALCRTWMLPNGFYRQFIWFDVNYQKTASNINFKTTIRSHNALDIADRPDRDFVRIHQTLTPKLDSRVIPFFHIELWFELNDIKEFTRVRYEPGVKIGLMDNMSMTIVYRREEGAFGYDQPVFNVLVANFLYTLDRSKQVETKVD